MPSVAELVYVKTNIGGFFFDAFFNVDHTSKTKITSHPVQTGANITDHAYQEPDELSIEIGMSDCMQDIIQGQFGGGWSRSVTAYEVLREMQQQRIPMQILTRLKLYQNMMIETISAPDNLTTLYGLRATITFREIIVASVKTVKISANPQVTDSTSKGNIETKPIADESLIYKWNFATGYNGIPSATLGVPIK